MSNITLKLWSSAGRWGLVEILNVDGTLNRRFKITGAQLDALHASGNGIPPGVTQQEWTSRRAVVFGKNFNVGDGMVTETGNLLVKLAELVTVNDIREFYLIIRSNQYTGIFPQVTVLPSVLAGFDSKQIISTMLAGPVITNITNGIVTVV